MMRVGAVGYATHQGLGYLMKDFFDNGVVDEVMVFRHPSVARETHLEWYPAGTPVLAGRPFADRHHAAVRDFASRVDVVLFFETPFDWQLLRYLRDKGKKSAVVTMYEWWPEQPPALPDLFLCPSDLDYDVFSERTVPGKYPTVARLNVPAPTGTWHRRTRARRFLHNAGHVGSRNHKGTDTLLRAMEYVESPSELTVRCQRPDLLDRLRRDYGRETKARVYYESGDVPRESLFDADRFDVYVAPERYNGLSLPLQEAFAAGMPVVTTDRHPANTWLPKELLVPVASTQRVRVAPGHLEIEESVVDPKDLARVLDGVYDSDVTRFSDAGKAWAEANSWDVLRPKYRVALEAIL